MSCPVMGWKVTQTTPNAQLKKKSIIFPMFSHQNVTYFGKISTMFRIGKPSFSNFRTFFQLKWFPISHWHVESLEQSCLPHPENYLFKDPTTD